MGEGVSFYAGNTDSTSGGNSKTQPDNAKASAGGPVEFYKGSPEYRSCGDTSNNTAKIQGSSTPDRGGKGSFVSPTDVG